VLNYAADEKTAAPTRKRIPVSKKAVTPGALNVSFFGAGNYATASLLPPLKTLGVNFSGLATASGRTAQGVASQFGFGFCAGEFDELLGDDTDLVMIATRHDTHAGSVVAALGKGKHVFVEKPLGLSIEELQKVDAAYQAAEGSQLMIGFNRRFSPLTLMVQNHFSGVRSPRIVNVRVNSGSISVDHWIQDPKQGGGRIIGEGCHFIDLACALAVSSPVSVHMFGSGRAEKSALLNDNVVISLMFANGSIANVTYVADGSKAMSKERIEVFGGGRSAVIEDFKEAFLYSGDSDREHKKLSVQDKGQKTMLAKFVQALQDGEALIPYEELALSSLATVCAVESLMIGAPVDVSLDLLVEQG
jgi:polar amino acid transport system substrate-binding protein